MNRNWQKYLLQHGCQLDKRSMFMFGYGCIVCTPQEFGDFYGRYVSKRPNDVTFEIFPLYDFEDCGKSYME